MSINGVSINVYQTYTVIGIIPTIYRQKEKALFTDSVWVSSVHGIGETLLESKNDLSVAQRNKTHRQNKVSSARQVSQKEGPPRHKLA